MASPSNVGALHRNLVEALGTAIASGKYPAGQVLTLDGVSAEHGVSRSVVRVASRRRVGLTILPSEKWNVFDPLVIRWRLESENRAALLVSLSELRSGFEPAAAALAARRADPDHLQDTRSRRTSCSCAMARAATRSLQADRHRSRCPDQATTTA